MDIFNRTGASKTEMLTLRKRTFQQGAALSQGGLVLLTKAPFQLLVPLNPVTSIDLTPGASFPNLPFLASTKNKLTGLYFIEFFLNWVLFSLLLKGFNVLIHIMTLPDKP